MALLDAPADDRAFSFSPATPVRPPGVPSRPTPVAGCDRLRPRARPPPDSCPDPGWSTMFETILLAAGGASPPEPFDPCDGPASVRDADEEFTLLLPVSQAVALEEAAHAAGL